MGSPSTTISSARQMERYWQPCEETSECSGDLECVRRPGGRVDESWCECKTGTDLIQGKCEDVSVSWSSFVWSSLLENSHGAIFLSTLILVSLGLAILTMGRKRKFSPVRRPY